MMVNFGRAILIATVVAYASIARAQSPAPPSLEGFSDAIHHWRNAHGDAYGAYAPVQVREIADNMLLYQRDNGGWVENRDPTRILSDAEKAQIAAEKSEPGYSFDNRNIYTQVAYLMGAYEHVGDERYRDAALRGLELILASQLEACGGWTHTSPPRNEFHNRLTFADEVTSGNLILLRRIARREAPFARLAEPVRARAAAALERGDACVLRLQIRQNGKLTGWAGQYDATTLAPLGGRSFELVSIVAQETVAMLRYLMTIPDPSPEVIAAVDGGVAWLAASRIPDVKIEDVPLPEPVRYQYHTARFDRRLAPDPGGPGIWARFYDLSDNSVVLANRDGVRAATYADVHPERRSGYSWYGDWPARLIARDYPAWKARIGG